MTPTRLDWDTLNGENRVMACNSIGVLVAIGWGATPSAALLSLALACGARP